MKKFQLILLVLLFSIGFILRLYKFNEPLADWHSFRQSDTAAVSQIFVNEGYNLLYPKYYDISNAQSGIDNPEGFRFVEFPIYNFIHAFLFKSIGILGFNEWGRMINILSSLVTALIVYLLVKKYRNYPAGIMAAGFFLLLPYSIFYSRTILPDVMTTTFIMVGIYFFDSFLDSVDKRRKIINYLVSLYFISFSFLLKPFALFYVLPFVYLAFNKYGKYTFLKWYLWIFAFISIIPLAMWRQWIAQFPAGIPVSDWLFNGNNIRFRPAFFKWIVYERITKLIMGYTGILFLFFGILTCRYKNMLFFLSFAVSSIIYISVIATGNIQHDYYQILIIPTVSIFAGLGAYEMYIFISRRINHLTGLIVFIVLSSIGFYFSWMQVKDYFNINDRAMVLAGQKANDILPRDAIVIAPYDGSTTFLNIIERRGWPIFQQSIEELIDKGAQYLVITNPTENDFSGFGSNYEIMDSSKEYLILKLK